MDPSLVPFADELEAFDPVSLALSGGSLLVSSDGQQSEIAVLDAETGAYQRCMDVDTGDGEPLRLDSTGCICVHEGLLYIADRHNQRVVVCRVSDGAHVRSIGKAGEASELLQGPYGEPYFTVEDYFDERIGSAPGEFAEPVGVCVGHGKLYVSEARGRRIQVLTLEGNPLQVLPLSVDGLGRELGGLCVDDTRVWCLGPHESNSCLHLFTVA